MQLVANFIHKSTCLYIVRNRTGEVNTIKIFPKHSSNEDKQIFIIWYAVYFSL